MLDLFVCWSDGLIVCCCNERRHFAGINLRRLTAGLRRAGHYSWPAGKMPAEKNAALESGAHYPFRFP
jgi:hypothetical protein